MTKTEKQIEKYCKRINLPYYIDIVKRLSSNFTPIKICVHTSTSTGSDSPARDYIVGTKRGAMGSALPHFYVDFNEAIQCEHLDSISYHAGNPANSEALSIECLQNRIHTIKDDYSEDNTAKLVAVLMKVFNISIDNVVTHTYYVHDDSEVFANNDIRSTTAVYGKKWCPFYIFRTTDNGLALQRWKSFKGKIMEYSYILNHDLNNDGKIDEMDAVILSRFLAGWNIEEDKAMDYNEDGKIDEKDYIKLSRYLTND